MLILPGPASFRFTCYYYRKAYYRAFAWDPPACAVGERSAHRYNGETKLFVFQNLHRYAMYVAVVFLVILWKDAIVAVLGWKDGVHVGVGLARHAHQLRAPQRLHLRLPQLPPPRRRQREQLLHGDARRAPPPALEAGRRCSTSGTCSSRG